MKKKTGHLNKTPRAQAANRNIIYQYNTSQKSIKKAALASIKLISHSHEKIQFPGNQINANWNGNFSAFHRTSDKRLLADNHRQRKETWQKVLPGEGGKSSYQSHVQVKAPAARDIVCEGKSSSATFLRDSLQATDLPLIF